MHGATSFTNAAAPRASLLSGSTGGVARHLISPQLGARLALLSLFSSSIGLTWNSSLLHARHRPRKGYFVAMADQQQQQQQHAPGGHYSGRNPVPTVKKFIENLDKDKAERDRKLDEKNASTGKHGDAVPHKAQKMGVSGTEKTVTDPTTGREVVIEDVSKAMMSQVENPQVGEVLRAILQF